MENDPPAEFARTRRRSHRARAPDRGRRFGDRHHELPEKVLGVSRADAAHRAVGSHRPRAPRAACAGSAALPLASRLEQPRSSAAALRHTASRSAPIVLGPKSAFRLDAPRAGGVLGEPPSAAFTSIPAVRRPPSAIRGGAAAARSRRRELRRTGRDPAHRPGPCPPHRRRPNRERSVRFHQWSGAGSRHQCRARTAAVAIRDFFPFSTSWKCGREAGSDKKISAAKGCAASVTLLTSPHRFATPGFAAHA